MLDLLSQGNYGAIAALPPDRSTPLSLYVCLRARIILGRYEEVERLLQDENVFSAAHEFYGEFLRTQLLVYQMRELPCALERMIQLSCHPTISGDAYLQGECHLVTAFLC